MADMIGGAHTSTALPRWSTLVLLTAGVLSVHLLLLTGGLPAFTASAAIKSADAPAARAENKVAPTHGIMAVNAPVRIGTVRWIAQTPSAPTEIVPRATPTLPAKAPPRAAARKPVAPPEPAPAPAPVTLPPAQEDVVETPPEGVTLVAQAPAPDLTPTTPTADAPPATLALPPAQPPGSTRLQYVVSGQIKGFNYSATGTLDWEIGGGRYNARMEMRMPLLGSRVQTSVGGVGPEGLLPERFADRGRSERAAHFEREQQRIRFSANTPESVLLPGAQDRLSLFLQIAGLLQARPQAYSGGQIIDMQVAGTGDAEIWRFRVGEESTLALPAGELRVRHLVRQPRKEFDSTVEMWLAPELNHLPVRLKVTQANGDMADQQLSALP